MNIQVDPNWWKALFNDIYLLTDARSVCDDMLTRQEVDFIEGILNLDRSASILDLCGGQGRHSLELSRRGFMHVTVLDYSQYLIDIGKKRAVQENLNTVFMQGDARDTGLPDASFHSILIMASSFGYFVDENENKRVLNEAYRLLAANGILLLDLPDRDHAIQNFRSVSSHRVNEDITVHRERELGDDIIVSREQVLSETKGCIRDQTYCTRLYSPEKISSLMSSVGFSAISFEKDFMNRQSMGDYGCMTNRMIVLAQKDTMPSKNAFDGQMIS